MQTFQESGISRDIQSHTEVPDLHLGVVDSSYGFCAIVPLVFPKCILKQLNLLFTHWNGQKPGSAWSYWDFLLPAIGKWHERPNGFYFWGEMDVWIITYSLSLSITKPVCMIENISKEFMCLSKPEWWKRVPSDVSWVEKVCYMWPAHTHSPLTHS